VIDPAALLLERRLIGTRVDIAGKCQDGCGQQLDPTFPQARRYVKLPTTIAESAGKRWSIH
jgi:hypothetical protein